MEKISWNRGGDPCNSRQERFENRLAYAYVGWILLLFILKYILGLNIPSTVLLISVAIYGLSGSKGRMLIAVVSCIPFSIGFQYRYLLLIFIAAYLFIERKGLRKPSLLIVLSLMAWEISHCLIGDFSIKEWFRDFAELLFLMIALSMDLEHFSYRRAIRVLAFATIGISAIMLWMQLKQNHYQLLRMLYTGAYLFRFGGSSADLSQAVMNFNPNGLGLMCNCAASGIVVLYIRSEHKTLDLVCLALLVLFGCMTLSKTYYLMLLLLIFSVLFMGKKEKFLRNIEILLGFVFILLMIAWLIPGLFQSFLKRVESGNLLSNRDILFNFYNKHILSSATYFLFGLGCQQLSGKIFDIYGYQYEVPHNFIQEVWCAWGLVGILSVGFLLYHMVRRSKQLSGEGRRTYHFVPFAVLLISSLSGQLITVGRNMLMLFFAFLCLCIPGEKKATPKPLPLDGEAAP